MTDNNRVDPKLLNERLDVYGEFSVCQFFKDDTYEYVRRWVNAEEAVNAAKHYCNSVAVRMGMVKRVIITDGSDMICFEWLADKGVVYPSKEN
jgi:hypothetical protein